MLIIASVALSFVAGLFHNIFNAYSPAVVVSLLSNAANAVGIIILVLMCYRIFSRKVEKRRAENERYLSRRNKSGRANRNRRSQDISRKTGPWDANAKGTGFWGGRSRGHASGSGQAQGRRTQSDEAHSYLACPFCGQRMRVPSGKGKIAVKCPSCSQKTIFMS